MIPQPQTQGYIVLTETDGTLGWLCHVPSLDAATSTMTDWLAKPERGDEDAAFILPVLGFGRLAKEG
jgi:hypothetical protein